MAISSLFGARQDFCVYPLARAYAISATSGFPKPSESAIENWAVRARPCLVRMDMWNKESSLRILAWSCSYVSSFARNHGNGSAAAVNDRAHAWRTCKPVATHDRSAVYHLFSEAVGLWRWNSLS